jgi:hypothetical protein
MKITLPLLFAVLFLFIKGDVEVDRMADLLMVILVIVPHVHIFQ